MKKRIMALLLSLVMALSLVPTTVWAAGASTEVADDGISVQALNTGHKIDVTFTVLYVGDEFRIGYNYGASEKTQFVCQYATNHSDTAYNNHTIAISDIKAAADRASVNSGYQIVGWSKESNANPTIWRLNMSGTTACNKGTTIYLVAKNPNPQVKFELNYNGNATGVSNVPGPQTTKSSAASVEFTISSQEPTRNGYDFLGWNTDPKATTAAYQPSEKITVAKNNNPTTLYAVWKEKTPPVTEPADPKLGENFDFSKKIVDVICETTNDHNDSYGLMNGYYTVSDKKQTNGKWSCSIELNLNKYFELYSTNHSGHIRTYNSGKGEPSRVIFGLDWNENTKKWTAAESLITAAKIFVKCDATQPEGPGEGPTTGTSIAGAVTVKCVTPSATDPTKMNHKPRTYALTDYTAGSVEGGGAGNYYCTLTLTNVDAFVTQYNTDTSAVHTKKNANETYKVRVKYVPKTDTVPAYWVLDGEPAVIEVENCTNSNIPNEPTFDEIFKALNGPVTVTCINRVWKDGNKVMDCGESKYAAKAGIVGQNYTIKKDENNANAWIVTFPVTNFVKSFTQTPAHDLYSNKTLNWSITWKDKKWTAEPVEPGVDDLVKLTHAPTDWREVNKVTHNGIWTSCENGQTGKCEYGIAVAFAKGDVVSVVPEAGVPGSYIATFKVSTYADTCAKACNGKNFKNSPRTHDLLTQETVQWKLYATDQADEKIGDQVLNHVWAATPVTKDKDDVCQVAHRVKVTFDENYNNASITDVMYKYNTNDVKEGTFPADPVREGYTFKGWNTKANGNGTAFDANTKVADDMTVYAQWEANALTIYYHGNGGKLENGKEQTTSNSHTDEKVTIKRNPFSREGYAFVGWTTEKDGTTIAYKGGEKHAFSASEITNGEVHFYAKWEATKYTITFDVNADGDKSAKVTPKTKPVTFDAAYGELANASRAGYTFQGWFTAKEGGTEVKSDDIVKTAGNHTLYAHWEITPHNVYAYLRTGDSIGDVIRLEKSTLDRLGLSEYNKNGFIPVGKFVSNTVLAEDEYYGADEDEAFLNVIKELKANIKLGAVGEKINWSWLYTPADVDDRIDGYLANDKEGYQLSGTLTLYSVMFKTEDSQNVKGMPKATYGTFYDYYIEGETITMPANPTRTGYDFKGWAVNGKTVDTTNGYTITGDVVFTAQWEKQTYTVKFDSKGGSTIAPQTVKYKDKVAEPKAPTKSGYTFDGWYTDEQYTTKYNFANEVTGNMTLYAKWDVKRTGTNPDAKNPYIKDNTTKTDGKKVESGKTFDAGIAMYVGLSILSVTGSAVVIRKRKDF